jgi:hypothetical protein
MTDVLTTVVLWLFVINLGIAFGAGVFESRIVVPQWFTTTPDGGIQWNAEAARDADVGLRFWVYVTTVPLTLLTVASLIILWWAPPPIRGWWLAAVVATVVDRVMTFSYFIPTMLALMRTSPSVDVECTARAQQWVRRGAIRHAATAVAWLTALKALSQLGS